MEWLTQERANEAIKIPWVLLALFWIGMWRRVKPTKLQESLASKLSYTAVILLGLGLLFAPVRWRILPYSREVGLAAVALNWAGVIFAIWARIYLGRNWSATVTVKEGHELMRSGPYAIVRHPIYFGMLLGSLGVAMETGRWPAPLGLGLVFVGLWLKSRVEERAMQRQFGKPYEEYRRITPALIPSF
jgi:protein-S-isoprenylcysteine O-methyltransferase Ste14